MTPQEFLDRNKHRFPRLKYVAPGERGYQAEQVRVLRQVFKGRATDRTMNSWVTNNRFPPLAALYLELLEEEIWQQEVSRAS